MTNCPLRITVFAPRYAVTAGSGQVQPEQPWEMHPADVMDVAGDHTRAVGGNDAAQIGHRQIRPMFGQQPGRMQPTAACATVAGDIQPRKTGGNLAKDNDTSGHARILVTA
jgi:hypothetical protein